MAYIYIYNLYFNVPLHPYFQSPVKETGALLVGTQSDLLERQFGNIYLKSYDPQNPLLKKLY